MDTRRRLRTRRLAALTAHISRPSPTATATSTVDGGEESDGEVVATWRPRAWPETLEPLKYVRTPRIPLEDMATKGLAFLNDRGYCVVSGVLSEEDCLSVTDRLWSTIEGLGKGIRRDDVTTWGNDRWFPGDVGLLGDNGANDGLIHSEPLWWVRSHPRMKATFAAIHDADDLLASFDGMSLFRPVGLNPEEWGQRSGWFHTDRRPYFNPEQPWQPSGVEHRDYVQSFVNILPTSPETGGNVIVPLSHRAYKQLAADFLDENGGINYSRVAKERPDVLNRAMVAHLERGDVFLWDDRTIHCNAPGVGRGSTAHTLQRIAFHISMSPKSFATEATLEERRRGALKGVRTGHKAHHPVPSNAWAVAEKRDTHAPGGWFPHPAPRVEFAAEHWDLIC